MAFDPNDDFGMDDFNFDDLDFNIEDYTSQVDFDGGQHDLHAAPSEQIHRDNGLGLLKSIRQQNANHSYSPFPSSSGST